MSKVKTGLIVLLAGLAIYLSSQLWFANTSSRNFFYTFFTRSQSPDSSDDKIFVQPYRLILNYGNNRFSAEYGSMSSNMLREACDGVIQVMLKDGEYLGMQTLNYSQVFEAPGYICEYAFDMPAAAFSSAYGKNGFADQIKNIDSIVLIPPDAVRDVTIVWLLDEVNMEMSGYSVKQPLPPITTNPNDLIQEVIYESSALSSYDFEDKNTFIAKKPKENYEYPTVSLVNPYAGNELLMSAIEKNVNMFFENPAAKLDYMGDNNVYTFADAETVVKYYQNDVLEYSNYRMGDSDAGLLNSFSIALNFIKSDKLVINEYYLADFTQQGDDYNFDFDYVVSGFPMILPDEYKRDDMQNGAARLDHSIEITVRDGTVVNYKKIVYNFITDKSYRTAALDFRQIMDGIGDTGTQEKISDVLLGYKLDRSNKACLYWIICLGGQTLSKIA